MNPNDAYARAGLPSCGCPQGYLNRALEEAQRAVTINPNLARTQTVLGFAYLTQVKIAEARAAFEKAIGPGLRLTRCPGSVWVSRRSARATWRRAGRRSRSPRASM